MCLYIYVRIYIYTYIYIYVFFLGGGLSWAQLPNKVHIEDSW